MLRGELNDKSRGLCSEEAPITEWLFGNQLKECLKEAELGERIAKNSSSKKYRGICILCVHLFVVTVYTL